MRRCERLRTRPKSMSQPTIGEGLRCLFVLIPIPRHNLRTAHPDLTLRPRGQELSLRSGDPGVRRRDRQADCKRATNGVDRRLQPERGHVRG